MYTSENYTFAELKDVLSEMHQLKHSYNPAHFIYRGGMNTDMVWSTPRAYAMRNFRLHINLTVCIYAPGVEVAYTYVNPNGFSYYIIDNVIAMATLRRCRNVLL